MPTYEYKCNACDHRLEAFQSMRDKPLKKCPECGKPALERLISAGGAIIFKGSGFYQTDYRSESYKKAAKAESASASSGDSSGSSKSDSKSSGEKSAAKSDSKSSKTTAAAKGDS